MGEDRLRQSDKTRYLKAIQHIESEEVPFQEDEFEPTVAGKILGRPVPPALRSYELPVADMVELNIKAGNDIVMVANLWELGRKNVIDAEGRKQYVDGTIKTRRDLAGIKYPDLGEIRKRVEEVLEGIEGTGLGTKYRPNNSLFLAETGIGYQDYYVNLKLDPDFIHEFLKSVQDYCFQELEVALSYPIDVFQLSVLFTSSMGPVVSREITEEFEYPQLRQTIKMIKDKGKPLSLHIDGVVDQFIDEFIEMGFSVINPLEPCGGQQDIYAIKQRYGDRIALHGNIDIGGVLAFGTVEEVVCDVREHLDRLSPGGGYICASSHNITEIIPIENFYAMRDTVLNYRLQGRPAARRR